MVKESLLVKGNTAFQQGDYAEALEFYERLLPSSPEALRPSIEFNRELTQRRLNAQYGEQARDIIQQIQRRVSMEREAEALSPDLLALVHDSGLFDADWYVAQYGKKYAITCDPLTHYLTYGAELATNPSPDFDTSYYLNCNQDVKEAASHPLLHFLKYGLKEGRLPKPPSQTGEPPKSLGGLIINGTHQLEWDSDANYWQSMGDDPHFYLDDIDIAEGAWCQLHLVINSTKKSCNAKIYFDYGKGFNEEDTLSLRPKFGEVKTCVIRTEGPLKAIRFDPMDCIGKFSVPIFKLVKVEESQALANMSRWLDRFNQKSPVTRKRNLADKDLNLLDELFDEYWHAFTEANRGNSTSYEEWIELVEKPSLPSPEQLQAALQQWQNQPPISIVVPVFNTPEKYLRECIESVQAQSYTNWELCISDDGSSQPHVRRVLQEYEKADSRIRVVYRPESGHISRSSNSALEIAQGEYVALMDHEDQLPEHALYFVVEALNDKPDAQIVYSDEDKIDQTGERFDPHFKSDWNPDLFYSQNYVSHLIVYRSDLLETINGFRLGVEGSQDQDLLLRCLPYVKSDEIIHIPRVLYHWRALEGSTARAVGEKDYTTEAGLRALRDYFSAQGPDGVEVEAGLVPDTYRVHWPVPMPEPLVSLLIPTRDRKDITELAVCSILEKTTYTNYEILILDNGSVEPETLKWFAQIQKQDKRVKVMRYDHPFNYSAINNFGVQCASGSVIGLVNNDVEVISPDWLTEMVSHVMRSDVGCVGAKLYYPDDTIQHAGVVLGIGGVASHPFKHHVKDSDGYFKRLKVVQNYSAVTAACLMVKRDLYEKVGGLDENNLAIAYNDIDFCLRVSKAGYKNVWTPYAELYHHESVSRGSDEDNEKIERLKNEREYMLHVWGEDLENDPFYNENLTRNNDDFVFDLAYTRKLNFENKVLYSWVGDLRRKKKYACIFASFDLRSKLNDYVIFYLEELARYFDIFFITTAENLHSNTEALEKLEELCEAVVVRKNEGYDFGSWKLGLEKYRARLEDYDGVLLANDSVYGPFFDLKSFIERFEDDGVDILGMTDSNELDYHLQSYFVMYKAKVLSGEAFWKFWSQVSIQGDKWDIIKKYEIGLSQRMMRYGKYNISAYCDMSGYPNLNHTHVHWRDLILKKKFPFLKIELVKKNPFSIDLSGMEDLLSCDLGYDFDLIKNHV